MACILLVSSWSPGSPESSFVVCLRRIPEFRERGAWGQGPVHRSETGRIRRDHRQGGRTAGFMTAGRWSWPARYRKNGVQVKSCQLREWLTSSLRRTLPPPEKNTIGLCWATKGGNQDERHQWRSSSFINKRPKRLRGRGGRHKAQAGETNGDPGGGGSSFALGRGALLQKNTFGLGEGNSGV